jgi:hypothetical protein
MALRAVRRAGERPSVVPAAGTILGQSYERGDEFFSPELAERVTGLYGVRPEIRFVEVAALVENAGVPA